MRLDTNVNTEEEHTVMGISVEFLTFALVNTITNTDDQRYESPEHAEHHKRRATLWCPTEYEDVERMYSDNLSASQSQANLR